MSRPPRARSSIWFVALIPLMGCPVRTQGVPDAGPDAGTDAGSDAGQAQIGADHPMGVNMPDLFRAYLGTAGGSNPDSARQQMSDAVDAGFNHARFEASGYWPSEMIGSRGWRTNPSTYWALMDQMVADARARGLRLIPSMLWNGYLFPDLAGEPEGQLFVPGSNSRKLAEQYLTQMVTRYANTDTILFWEIGNELNLTADLDVSTCDVCSDAGVANNCAALAPSLGTPCRRTVADNYFSCNSCQSITSSQEDLAGLDQDLAMLIHSLDPRRAVSSGDSLPRSQAWHLARSPCPACDWTPDTPDQFAETLLQTHGAAVDIVSIHQYPGNPDLIRFGSDDSAGIQLLSLAQGTAASAGKQLFVGEYGEFGSGSFGCEGQTLTCSGDPSRSRLLGIENAIAVNGIAYSAIWAFEWYQFCPTLPGDCFGVTEGEPSVEELSLHNQAWNECVGAPDGGACATGLCSQSVCVPARVADLGFAPPENDQGWGYWTNCTACQPGSNQVSELPDGGYYLSLRSHDLPCSGGCQYPGVYASSPLFFAQPGHLLIQEDVRTTATHAQSLVEYYSADGGFLGQQAIPVAAETSFNTLWFWSAVPAGTASAGFRFDLLDPDAGFDIRGVVADWQP